MPQAVKVYVPTYIPIRAELTARGELPAIPAPLCFDAELKATICNEDLLDLVDRLFVEVLTIYKKLDSIRDLQPTSGDEK